MDMDEGRCHGDHGSVKSVMSRTLGGFLVPLPVSKCPSVTPEAGSVIQQPYDAPTLRPTGSKDLF